MLVKILQIMASVKLYVNDEPIETGGLIKNEGDFFF